MNFQRQRAYATFSKLMGTISSLLEKSILNLVVSRTHLKERMTRPFFTIHLPDNTIEVSTGRESRFPRTAVEVVIWLLFKAVFFPQIEQQPMKEERTASPLLTLMHGL